MFTKGDGYPVHRTLTEAHPDPIIDATGVSGFTPGGTGTTYYGYAQIGTGLAQPKWKIKKVVNDGAGNIMTTYAQDAAGNIGEYTNIWNNRTELTYTR